MPPYRYATITKQQKDAAGLYASLLDEAMVRITSIDFAVRGLSQLHPAMVQDFCFLELRMLCELIALGCLVAHGEINATQASILQKEFAADKIIRRLETLHPNFYPHAIRIYPIVGEVKFDRVQEGFLTKRELIKLYAECGSKLHRGSLKKLVNVMDNVPPVDYRKIVAWTNKIIVLLNQHHIASYNNLTHFICVMKSEEHGGHAAVATALSPLPD